MQVTITWDRNGIAQTHTLKPEELVSNWSYLNIKQRRILINFMKRLLKLEESSIEMSNSGLTNSVILSIHMEGFGSSLIDMEKKCTEKRTQRFHKERYM